MKQILTLSESAKYLRLAPVTIYRLARRGGLPAVKCGRSWRFHRGQLEQWLCEQGGKPHAVSKLSPASSSFRHLSTRESEAVCKFITHLESRYPQFLKQVILYGSRARGDFQSNSDIDLLIVVRGIGARFLSLRKEIASLTHDFSFAKDVPLQTLTLSKEEWGQPSFKSFLLVEKIKREGILLHG